MFPVFCSQDKILKWGRGVINKNKTRACGADVKAFGFFVALCGGYHCPSFHFLFVSSFAYERPPLLGPAVATETCRGGRVSGAAARRLAVSVTRSGVEPRGGSGAGLVRGKRLRIGCLAILC